MASPRKLNTDKHSVNALALARTFSERIIGQPDATNALINILDKFESGFYDRSKPIASLLFLGPTGTGKTATVEAFARGLFGSPARMFKIDCGEFQHSHEIAKLIGSPPGYLGHRETGALIDNAKVKKMQEGGPPLCIILFDEIEKASDGLWNLLLGILDKGILTLGTNEIVDLKSAVIVMTSNIGSKELAAKVGRDLLGFEVPNSVVSDKELRDTAVNAARRKFMPEFMNRLDSVVMFNTLTTDNLRDILEIELDELRRLVTTNSIERILLTVSPAAKKQILAEGYDERYNARELKRTLERRVVLPISRAIASKQIRGLDTAIVDWDEEFLYYVEENL